MAATEYTPVSWSDNEPLLTEKMSAMTQNDQYLFENMPRVYYNAHGVKKATGTKIMTGFVAAPYTQNVYSSNTFNFGSFFSAGCRPVVVAGAPHSWPRIRYLVAVRGIGTTFPDHRGFEIRVSSAEVNAKENRLPHTVWVPFIAVGY
jgi:hypothetical protein